MRLKIKWKVFLLALAVCLLAACSAGGEKESEVTTLIYANLTESGVDRGAVSRFNETHQDVQIEVRDYFDNGDSSGRSGKERLLTEIGAGKIPDIIDLGRGSSYYISVLPYESLVHKGILEDLWPYIENDPELGREGVLEAPLKAAEVDGGLYTIFSKVGINTLVGAESVVGDRTSWTLEDFWETFASMPQGSTPMALYTDAETVFFELIRMNVNNYVNWETGKCFFNEGEFKAFLEFSGSFPREHKIFTDEESIEAGEEIARARMEGRQMVETYVLMEPLGIQHLDALYGLGGKAALVGYPVEDDAPGSSFYIYDNRKLCMSSTCQDKEAAWEFLRETLLPKYEEPEAMYQALTDTKKHGGVGIPVNRADYNLLRLVCMNWGPFRRDPRHEYHKATEEEVRRFDDFVNSIGRIELMDDNIFNIIEDVSPAYFAGDKTLDETAALIQNRVGLYVNEQM